MADPSISFTSGQLVGVLCSAIGALGAITAAAIKLLYNNLNRTFKRLEVRQYNLLRSVFVLLTRLHPEKAGLIVEVMEQQFADSVMTSPEQPNGEAKFPWRV